MTIIVCERVKYYLFYYYFVFNCTWLGKKNPLESVWAHGRTILVGSCSHTLFMDVVVGQMAWLYLYTDTCIMYIIYIHTYTYYGHSQHDWSLVNCGLWPTNWTNSVDQIRSRFICNWSFKENHRNLDPQKSPTPSSQK